jgi:hypothetical protein
MRFIDHNASTKVTAAASTVTFTSQDFDPAGVVALIFLFTGAGMTFGDLTRLRVKNSGVTAMDVDQLHFMAFCQRYYGVAPVAGDVRFMIPFYLPGGGGPCGEDSDYRDQCQMIRGSQPSVELVIGAGGAAGTVQMGWIKSTAEPKLYPTLLGSAMGIAAATFSSHYPVSEGGAVKGFGINSVGATRVQFTLGGKRRVNIEGVNMLIESQDQERNTLVVADPHFVDLGGAEPAPQGSSYLELDAAAGWAGAANELSLYSLRPQ